jgi:uncharacterized membrane protein
MKDALRNWAAGWPPSWPSLGHLLLLGSLCLNLVLGGYIASQLLAPPMRPLTGMQPPRVLALLASQLPASDAAMLRDAYRGKQEQVAAARALFERSVAKVLTLLAQPELDAPALRTALEDARIKRLRQNDTLVEAFLEALEKMPYQTRRDLAARFRGR